MVKTIGAFVAGTAVGCAATYFYLTKVKKVEYQIVRPSVPTTSQNEEEEPEYVESEEPRKEDDGWRVINMADEIQINSEPVDYHKISNTKQEIGRIKLTEPVEVAQNDEPMADALIYEISERDFIEDNKDLENTKEVKTLSLWTLDGTLIDEDTETIITDINNTISESIFDEWKNNPLKDVIYVRNKERGIDYELFKREESFAEYQEME